MITASHNEPEWNGFKFFWRDGSALNPEQMQAIITSYHETTRPVERPYVDHYIRFLLAWIGPATVERIRRAHFRIVVDPNGGAILVVLKRLFDHLQIEAIGLNMEPGRFAHAVEPTSQALQAMAPIIKEQQAHFGVGWDCDGDRLAIMLPNGELLSGHYILAMVVDQVLRKVTLNSTPSLASSAAACAASITCAKSFPVSTGDRLPFRAPPQGGGDIGANTVVINGATSGIVHAVAQQYGATIIETDVGEANVVRTMKESNRGASAATA